MTLQLVGERFGLLRAISRADANGYRGYECVCDCGARVVVRTAALRRGATRSCGCLKAALQTRHGHARKAKRTTEHRTWGIIRQRCENPNNPDFPSYGGRGIKVCESWHTFESFLADMGAKPSRTHSIDRIDNEGDYAPGNCRWATPMEQAHNRRPARKRAA